MLIVNVHNFSKYDTPFTLFQCFVFAEPL